MARYGNGDPTMATATETVNLRRLIESRLQAAWPASLLGRTNAVLAVGASAIAITALAALWGFVVVPISDRSADDEAGLVVLAAKTWVELSPEARPYFEIELVENHDLIISSNVRDLPFVADGNAYYDLIETKLSQRLGEAVRLMESDGLLWASVPMGGRVMQVGFPSQRRDVQPLVVGLVIFGTGALIVFIGSALIVRRLAGPLEAMAQAAGSFRGAEGFKPLPEEGPTELVTLASSFNAMARDVTTLLSNRTTLLAGISHDLRTPLARMRLALELLPDDVDNRLVKRFERNLAAMDELIGDALRFARGAGEAARLVDFEPYMSSLVTGIDEDLVVHWRGDVPKRVSIAPGALERVLANLIDNARQHGSGAEVTVDGGEEVCVHVTDVGPGIPRAERERVFEPFYRLDAARRSATGGSGLGLAIVKQLCDAHGWRVAIGVAPGGGADVNVSLKGSAADSGAVV